MTKRLVHRFWMGPERSEHIWVTKVVLNTHSDCDVIEWSLDTLPDSIRGQIDPLNNPVHIANLVRYWALYEFGGLWLDHDVIPLTDLTLSPEPWTASIQGFREGSSMWFPYAGHLMMKEMLEISMRDTDEVSPPAQSGAKWLRIIGDKYADVKKEPRVLPFDSNGQRVGTNQLLAMHLWSTTTAKSKKSEWR